MSRKIEMLTRGGLIAAMYVVLCVVLAPMGYGPVQVRVSEALTLLVVFCPEAIAGVTIGCLISNIIGFYMGTAFGIDILVGTLTTLAAAIITYRLRHVRTKGLAIIPSLPPVLLNAIIVGGELTILLTPQATLGITLFNMFTVGLGQVVSCTILGVLLVRIIDSNPAMLRAIGARRPQT